MSRTSLFTIPSSSLTRLNAAGLDVSNYSGVTHRKEFGFQHCGQPTEGLMHKRSEPMPMAVAFDSETVFKMLRLSLSLAMPRKSSLSANVVESFDVLDHLGCEPCSKLPKLDYIAVQLM